MRRRRRELVRFTDHKVVESVSIAELCVDAALFLSLFCSSLWGWRYEQVHLIPSLPLLVYAENNGKRMPKRDWCQARQELCVFRLIPVSGELVWRPNDDGVAFES